MTALYVFIGVVIGAGLVGGVAFVLFRQRSRAEERTLHDAKERGNRIIADAEKRADETRKEASAEAQDIRDRAREFENETKERKKEVGQMEQRLLKKEESIEKKSDLITGKEIEILGREKKVDAAEEDISAREAIIEEKELEIPRRLEQVARFSQEEAKAELINQIQDEAKLESAREVREIVETAREDAENQAKRIIGNALSRYAGEYVAERLVSVVALPNDEMKGRIIGREGRNIRAFEAATGIDVIIDDTPEAVILSGFSGVRREVARLAMEKLLTDGRIHPGRIEEVVQKTEQEVMALVKQAGEHAVMELGIFGLHSELVKTLGKLKYRTSYGQNVLGHSIEVAHLAGLLGCELGMKIKVCKRAGILHDLGKAIDHEQEGPHATLGAQLAERHGETPQIVAAIAGHHEGEAPSDALLTQVVMAADAISGARPGARREMLESYVKRLEDLEGIASSFAGVDKAFAFQAGREVRVLVDAGRIDDDRAVIVCKDIAQRIQDELTYPGQIKVVVIREMRTTAVAK
ncbi:MAG: ribonuclease Y [Pseudomonadota bacterium]